MLDNCEYIQAMELYCLREKSHLFQFVVVNMKTRQLHKYSYTIQTEDDSSTQLLFVKICFNMETHLRLKV